MRTLPKMSFVFAMAAVLGGCATLPRGASVVTGFDKARYLGSWYEIARYDFAFERNLDNTTAEYRLLDDGSIGVTNRGHDYVKDVLKVAKGKARFRGLDTVAALEVSFFGPFYAAYNVVALDKDYRYALVAGSSTKYLWILSRTRTIPEGVKAEYLALARSLGYDTDKLIWVRQDE